MNTKRVVAVIGASGEMGSAIAKSLAKGNYRSLLHSSKKNKVRFLIDEIKGGNSGADIEIVDDCMEVCWEADIIILAIPYTVEKEVAENIRKVVNQKVVISISNPINDTRTQLIAASDTSAAEELQKKLPFAKVVKAFNTTFAGDFYNPTINGQQVDCFIAGNDKEAIQVVYDLVKTAGFNPVIAGDLSVSRTLESIQLLLIQLATHNNYKSIARWKVLHN